MMKINKTIMLIKLALNKRIKQILGVPFSIFSLSVGYKSKPKLMLALILLMIILYFCFNTKYYLIFNSNMVDNSVLASIINLFVFNFKLFCLPYRFSLGNLVNLIIILLLICFNVFLIFNEINNPNEINNDKLQSGIIDNNLIKNLSKIMVGTFSAYGSYLTVKDHHSKNKKDELEKEISAYVEHFKTEITKVKISLAKAEGENTRLSAAATAKADDVNNSFDCFQKSFYKYTSLTEQMEQLQKSQAVTKTDQDKSRILSELEMIKTDRDYQKQIIANCLEEGPKHVKTLEDINTDDKQSMFFDLDNILEYYNSFHAMSRLALSLLVFNYVIVSCLISIGFIFYGDYLIQRFNLENKYPTIYKIVSLRVKYQRYYLIMNISLIFIVLLLETLFCVIVINDFG